MLKFEFVQSGPVYSEGGGASKAAQEQRHKQECLCHQRALTMIAESLQKVEDGSDLAAEEAEEVMGELLEGHLEQMQIVGLLTSLRAKGEAVEELVGFARAMRRRVDHPGAQAQISPLVDTCGTGGDGGGTFNVSTAAALVFAGAGVRVSKLGKRSFRWLCGSPVALEELG